MSQVNVFESGLENAPIGLDCIESAGEEYLSIQEARDLATQLLQMVQDFEGRNTPAQLEEGNPT